jgi:hypothetical protein
VKPLSSWSSTLPDPPAVATPGEAVGSGAATADAGTAGVISNSKHSRAAARRAKVTTVHEG